MGTKTKEYVQVLELLGRIIKKRSPIMGTKTRISESFRRHVPVIKKRSPIMGTKTNAPTRWFFFEN